MEIVEEKSPKLHSTLRRRWFAISLVVISALAFGGFILWSSSYYPLDKFAGVTAEFLPRRNTVLIRGHMMGSIFCVGKIRHREQGDELNIRMRYSVACPKQNSGDFSIEIPTSPNVRRVTYGNERSELLVL